MNTKTILCELLLLPVLVAACAGQDAHETASGPDLDETAETDDPGEPGDDAESGETEPGTDETGEGEDAGDTEDSVDDAGETEGGETGMGETGMLPDTDGMETGDTGVEPPFGDGDSSDFPAVLAQFRNTAGAPVSVTGPLFNEEPLDVRGLQYVDAIAPMGDQSDHLAFNIVPGDNDPTIRVSMECDDPSVRADILDEEGDMVGSALCGEGEQAIFLAGAGALDVYRVVVQGGAADAEAIDYTLSLDAFCFQQCSYAPYVP